MRILYHHRTQAEDGQAVHVRALLAAFEQEGHEVQEVGLVRHGTQGGAPAERARWGWVARLPRAARELAEYAYSGLGKSRLVGAAARFQPDFVYERYAFGNAAGVLARARLGVPLVLEVNAPLVDELERTRGLAFPRLARRLEGGIWRGAERVCVVTAVLGELLVERGVERERLLVTPNGVHLEQYDYPERGAARRAALADLGLDPEPPGLVLGFVGYYRDWHRLDLVLEALAGPHLRAARLVLVGEGPAREGLERHARALGVERRVRFAGARAHARVPALLPAFDVALVPAINPYASPLKLHEYMAAGLAIVAPDQPNLREVLAPRENALLVPREDAAALAAALCELAADPELRARLGAAARRTVVERELTWRGNARRVVRAVEALRSVKRLLHALSFDVEEYFHVANLRGEVRREEWDGIRSRLDVGMQAALECLRRQRATATFFFLGWVAERRPDLVRRCVDAGHEVASHGYEHLFLQDLGPQGLERDLARTEEALVAAGAPRPLGFRASTFTLTRATWWAFDVLARRGYHYDSSVHPIRHPLYGVPDFAPGISRVTTDGGAALVEFPVSTWRCLGRNWPMGGGGYFRLLPGRVTRAAVAGLERRGVPASIYLHPWELDPAQPRYAAPLLKRFRHYVNLERTLPRLERLLERFRFASLREALVEAGWLPEQSGAEQG